MSQFDLVKTMHDLCDLELRLGEGTGAVLATHIIEAALRMHREMATFAEAGVSNREDGEERQE